MCCKYKGLMKDRWKYWWNSSIAKVSVIEHGLRKSDVGHVWNFNIRIHNSKKKKILFNLQVEIVNRSSFHEF